MLVVGKAAGEFDIAVKAMPVKLYISTDNPLAFNYCIDDEILCSSLLQLLETYERSEDHYSVEKQAEKLL